MLVSSNVDATGTYIKNGRDDLELRDPRDLLFRPERDPERILPRFLFDTSHQASVRYHIRGKGKNIRGSTFLAQHTLGTAKILLIF